MKFKKLILLFLLLAIIVSVFCSCDQIMELIDSNTPVKQPTDSPAPDDTNEEEPPTSSDIYPTFPSWELFCYSIMPDAETYNYGDEINITVTAQIYENLLKNQFYSSTYTDITFTLDESPAFEIIGDNSICFNDTTPEDFVCNNENGNAYVVNFKIRITEPDFVVNELQIRVISHHYVNKEDILDENSYAFKPLYFISDSQGIIIYSMPYSYNHYYNKEDTLNLNFLSHTALIKTSFDREYLNGVEMDELIDRYNGLVLGEKVDFSHNYYTDFVEFEYVTKDVRFIIKLPKDHEYAKLSQSQNRYDCAKSLILFAYESGVITEEEYEIERARLNSDNVSFGGNNRYKDIFVFTFPEGDSYYNYVLDLR